ncbi:SUKH-4 family immunity protein [Streptomyces sp. I05A-00742]|uniref:SUKH-4 family immunity protein n=1 Tax=Streptomyces sp. I05A-00742 TaxID=2732853 RepID=UPI0014895901|nr:SUKH-4 family immunity protein [Streptomyces sp. I05A-00742]
MVTFAQAQERAERWVNGDVPAYLHREVKVREFDLGFVAWAEDREGVASTDSSRTRLVIARDSGETTLWPGLPVGEVIRRYEEEYGTAAEPAPVADEPPGRVDLNATSFLLSPPQWLQDAADAMGIPDRKRDKDGAAAPSGPDASQGAGVGSGGTSGGAATSGASGASGASGTSGTSGSGEPSAPSGVSSSAPSAPAVPSPSSPATPPPAPEPVWAGADVSAGDEDDESAGLPATVLAPALSGSDADDTPPPGVRPDAKTELMPGGSSLPRTTLAPAIEEPGAPPPQGGPAVPPPGPGAGVPAATVLASPSAPPAPPARPGAGTPPPPPPAAPNAPAPGGTSGHQAPGGGSAAYAATMLATPGPGGGPSVPGAPAAPGAPTPPPGAPAPPGTPPGGVHAAATMLAGPNTPGAPQPPGAPNPPGAPGTSTPPGAPGSPGVQPPAAPGAPGAAAGTGAPGPHAPGAPGAPGTPPGGVHAAATMLASPGAPGVPPMPNAPQPPGGYGYPQAPAGVPTVGPGYMAVLRYRAQDGSEQQVIRRSAPGTPHPEWQILHELRAMNVPPQQVLELHTELESCDLPGGYCARMVRETWPQVRVTHTAGYGRDHVTRRQGVRHLVEHQGELHQVAGAPARPAPNRVPLPQPHQVRPAPPIAVDAIARELLDSFGPQGVFRFDQRAVSRQGVPEVVAQTLVWAGLPADFGPFFWAQAQPGRPVPTLAELALEHGAQPASDAGSYLVMGSDFGRRLCVQYGTAHIVAVPLEAAPDGRSAPPQFVNTSLPQFVRSLALLGRMWRWRYGLTQEQAGRWTVDFQDQLAALDPVALSSPENWWAVLLEQMWDGLF